MTASSTFENAIRSTQAGTNKEIIFTIQSVTGNPPDSDGDIYVTVNGELSNATGAELDKFSLLTLVFDGEGRFIDSTTDDREESVSNGDSITLETSLRLNVRSLGNTVDSMKTLVIVRCFSASHHAIGTFHVPTEALSPVSLPTASLDSKVQILSGSLSKSVADSDGDSRVLVNFLMQNLTAYDFPFLETSLKLTDKKKNELYSGCDSASLQPGTLGMVTGSTSYVKEKKLSGASVDISTRLYVTVGKVAGSFEGLQIEEEDQEQDPGSASESVSDKMMALFERYEDSLQIKSVLVGVAPASMVGVQLHPETYTDGGDVKYKCTILVEVSEDEPEDQEVFESIADTVSDFLRDNDLSEEMEAIGVDSDLLDWFVVKYQNTGENDVVENDCNNLQDLRALEGEDELFSDLICDLRLELLEVGQSKVYGTYKNTFTCVSIEHKEENAYEHKIKADFYDEGNHAYLVLIVVGEEKSLENIYWLDDVHGSAIPSEHPDWAHIRENLDIFLDSDD